VGSTSKTFSIRITILKNKKLSNDCSPTQNKERLLAVHRGYSLGLRLPVMLRTELCGFRPIFTSMKSMMNPGCVICVLWMSISPLIILIAFDMLGRSPHFSCTQSKATFTNPTASVPKKLPSSIGSTSFRRLSALYISHACINRCPEHYSISKSKRLLQQTRPFTALFQVNSQAPSIKKRKRKNI